ncbi:bacterial type serine tyrosine phosphatase [Cryptosporidium bovis]|uniref:bacterial type serine tyrosine phosphatase n=1 Tax=Cryptosporidium bovis TaxID=310047 RepID=UPI00351A929F|nr:bacterial type serine tyrosine phosphatase [Cryptosporidium bovis]
MFLSTAPFNIKPLIRIEGSLDSSYENDLQSFIDKFLDSYEDQDEKRYMKYGYEYYGNILLGKRILLDIIPDIRDVSLFVEHKSLRRYILYRGGRPGCVEPDKLKHVVKDTLGIKTIIDLRGVAIFEESQLTKDETLSRSIIWKYYNPLFENNKIDEYIKIKVNDMKKRKGCNNLLINTNDQKYVFVLNSLNFREPLKVVSEEEFDLGSVSNGFSDFIHCLDCTKRNKKHTSENNVVNNELLIENRKESNMTMFKSYKYYMLRLISHQYAENWYIQKYISEKSIGEIYFDFAIFDSMTVSRALKIITVSQPPILIHGNLGKDRVSVIVALVLKIVGISDEYIIRDYCASEAGSLSIKDSIDFEMARLPDSIKRCKPEYINIFFSKLINKFGTIDTYLDEIDFNESWRASLRQKFTENHYN